MSGGMTIDADRRAPCPVCGVKVTFPWSYPGENVSGKALPAHFEGLSESRMYCGASGLLVFQAQQMAPLPGLDLSMRAHP